MSTISGSHSGNRNWGTSTTREYGNTGTQQPQGTQGQQNNPNVTIAEGGVEQSYSAGAPAQENTFETPAGTVNTTVQGPSVNLDASANVSVGSNGIDVDLNLTVDANLISAGANLERTFTFDVNGEEVSVTVDLGAEGAIGVNGELNLHLHIGPDGVQLSGGAEGFAGAQGTLSGGIDVAVNGNEIMSSDASITIGAGVGAGAEFEIGADGFHASAYAMAGVGVGFEVNGNVNLGNLAWETPGLLTNWF